MAEKNSTLRGLIQGAVYDLLPKTNVYNVWVDSQTTLAAKLAEVITSLNGKVTQAQVETAIEEALAGFESDGGNSPIKPFPVTIVGDKKYVYVTELEDKTFYCLDPSSCEDYVQFSDKNIYEGAQVHYVDKNHIYLHEITGQSSGVLHGKSVPLAYRLNQLNKVIIYANSGSMEYLETGNQYAYTPTQNYHPATKKYVDYTVSQKISEIVFPEIPEIPEPVQGDWNQNDPTADDYIKNRTHWVGVNGTNTLEWDGNTDGLASFSPDGENTFYKVTDSFVGDDDLVGGVITVSGVMDVPITAEMIGGEAGDGLEMYQVAYNDTVLLLTVNQDLSMEGITLEKGTYLLSMGAAGHVSKVTLLTPAFGEEIVHKIDPKFLPEGGFGYDDTKELLPESSHTFTEEMDFMSPLSSALGLKVGESYTVVWNGTEYSCECVTFEMDGMSCPAIGDANVFINGEPSGEYPFLIFDIPAEAAAQIGIHAAVMGLDGSESATVKVIKESIHTIDPKFMPVGYKAPNPNALTFTGAVQGTYDGSEALTINIPAVSSNGIAIPDYWQTALDNGVEEINIALLKAGYNKSAFLFYTDAHWNYGSQMSPTLLKYLYQKTGMNKTFFGGDIVNNEADDYDTMAYLWAWRNQLKDLLNHHSVVGNHDDGNTTNNLFDEKYVYGYLLAAEETPDIVRGDAGLYYYIDNPSEKTRYLFLDTAFQTVLYDAAQAQFVVDALESAQAGWHIVAVSHIWYNTDYDQNPPAVGSLSYAGAMLLNLFDKYNARGSGSLSVAASSTDNTSTTIAYDFTSCGGKVEFCIGGHTHWDYDGASTGGIPVILCETDSQHVRSGLGYEPGTTTEASVNGIVANYETGEISVIRIGRGSSRVVNGTGSDNPEEEEPETPVAYTNVLKTAINTDGSLYNGGAGYKDNTRFSTSSKVETTATGWDITGYIPAANGDIFRFKNMQFLDLDGTGGATSRAMVYLFDSNFEYVSCSDGYTPTVLPTAAWNHVLGENGDIVQFTIPAAYSGYTYIRIGAKDINENSIITVNEEIV